MRIFGEDPPVGVVRCAHGARIISSPSSFGGEVDDEGEDLSDPLWLRPKAALVPLPVAEFRISMTYHDVGCDKLAEKNVDLTINMAASAGTPDWG